MIKKIFNAEDEKMLDDLKTKSAKKPEIIKCILFFFFMRIITSLKCAFVFTFLIFISFFTLFTYLYGFSLLVCFIYIIVHFLFFEFYIKKEHEKSIKSYHKVTLLAIEILKIRLAAKFYE